MIQIGNSWDEIIGGEFEKDYFRDLQEFLREEYSRYTVYPKASDIFNALKLTPYDQVKIVIIGQDPYHEPGQAHGLCFSVKDDTKIPPSLVNIYKELRADLGISPPKTGSLEGWARNGVLLLNTVLTVREHEANSHKGRGWEIFTDKVIESLNEDIRPKVFILWGANAKAKEALITNPVHCILKGAHPSPFSANNGFFGGRYFSKANEFLIAAGEEPVNWKTASM